VVSPEVTQALEKRKQTMLNKNINHGGMQNNTPSHAKKVRKTLVENHHNFWAGVVNCQRIFDQTKEKWRKRKHPQLSNEIRKHEATVRKEVFLLQKLQEKFCPALSDMQKKKWTTVVEIRNEAADYVCPLVLQRNLQIML
jgi:hypothetical protein